MDRGRKDRRRIADRLSRLGAAAGRLEMRAAAIRETRRSAVAALVVSRRRPRVVLRGLPREYRLAWGTVAAALLAIGAWFLTENAERGVPRAAAIPVRLDFGPDAAIRRRAALLNTRLERFRSLHARPEPIGLPSRLDRLDARIRRDRDTLERELNAVKGDA